MDNNFFLKKLKITHVIFKISEKSYRNEKKKEFGPQINQTLKKKYELKKRK
jgi:hypothetical protein